MARDPVELRETHISWVLLTGDRAYKVKKPSGSRSSTTARSSAGTSCAARRSG